MRIIITLVHPRQDLVDKRDCHPKPLKTETTQEIIRDLLKWDVVVNDGETILEAIELHRRYGYSFWDSMILQAAIQGGADLLFSEDLTHGQKIEGVLIKNPFREILIKTTDLSFPPFDRAQDKLQRESSIKKIGS